jgi:hypothetical protein
MRTSTQKKPDKANLNELGRLAVNVFARKKGAKEKFIAKASELDLAPRVTVEKPEHWGVLEDLVEFLYEEERGIGDDEKSDLAYAERFLEVAAQKPEYVSALHSIAVSADDADVMRSAMCLSKLIDPTWAGLTGMDLVTFLATFEYDLDVLWTTALTSFRLEAEDKAYYKQSLFLPHMAKSIFSREIEVNEVDIVFAFSILYPIASDYSLKRDERVVFISMAEKELCRLDESKIDEVHRAELYYELFRSMKAVWYPPSDYTVDLIKSVPEVIEDLQGYKRERYISRKRQALADSVIQVAENGTKETKRWMRLNKERILRIARRCKPLQEIDDLRKIKKRLSKLKDENGALNLALHLSHNTLTKLFKESYGELSREVRKWIQTHSSAILQLEDVHKGYLRKYSEALSSGNFGVLEYLGNRIVYALVNYDDINNIGRNTDDLILVARDKAVDQSGVEDVDLQKIIAVHEFVEIIAQREGKGDAEAHNMAIRAQEEYVQEHELQNKYSEFMKTTGQVWSNGNGHAGFE